jgi:hypothetical protein
MAVDQSVVFHQQMDYQGHQPTVLYYPTSTILLVSYMLVLVDLADNKYLAISQFE